MLVVEGKVVSKGDDTKWGSSPTKWGAPAIDSPVDVEVVAAITWGDQDDTWAVAVFRTLEDGRLLWASDEFHTYPITPFLEEPGYERLMDSRIAIGEWMQMVGDHLYLFTEADLEETSRFITTVDRAI